MTGESNAPQRILIYECLSPIADVRERFEAAGVGTVVMPARADDQGSMSKITRREFVAAADGCDATMGLSAAKLSREIFEALPRLKYVSKIGIGYDNIDIEAATERGVLVTNTPAPEEIVAVAEHTIALMLACLKRFDFYNRERMRSEWLPDVRVQAQVLTQRTVGIVGFGRIGKAVAHLLQGWDVRILVSDRVAVEVAPGIEQVPLDLLLRQADVVTIHVNADSHTEGPLLGRDKLSLMKPSAVLINTARGILIDQQYLGVMLNDGRLSAAGLDVFHPQPPSREDPLFDSSNLIATPHSAAWSLSVGAAIENLAVENALAMLNGELPDHVLNREAVLDADAP
jgi:D-3-phosphoglycerate dehydrogenase